MYGGEETAMKVLLFVVVVVLFLVILAWAIIMTYLYMKSKKSGFEPNMMEEY